jgi:sulfate/thiosulfate-binding protein
MNSYRIHFIFAALVILLSLSAAFAALHGISENNSTDPSLAMYEDFNKVFIRQWKARSGIDVTIKPVRSKSGTPVRATVDGLDVITLALSYDAEALEKNEAFMLPGWQKPSPQNSPYTSTIVFLVRKGNPRKLQGWDDLTRPGIAVVTANPKVSGSGRWSYLAAWGYALKQSRGDEAAAFEFVKNLFANVKSLDHEAPEAITAFVERGVGDVLLAWESEAHLLVKERGSDKFEVITPAMSILAEPTVNVVTQTNDKNGAREIANAYVDFLYTAKAQDIVGKYYYRPRDEKAAAKYATRFPPMDLFSIDEVFGGWKEAQNMHFAYGGIFDQIRGEHVSPMKSR